VSDTDDQTIPVLFLFFVLTLIVLSIESCVDSTSRRKAAEREYYQSRELEGQPSPR
jgi:hypothetical protein